MLDIVQSFPLLSYCIVSPIYISPICNVENYYSEKIKIRNSLFFSLHNNDNPSEVGSSLGRCISWPWLKACLVLE